MQRCKLFCRIVLLFCVCFFRASLGFADTISCSAGWYLPAGATECIACPQNSSSAAGADICTCLDGFTVTGTSDGAVTTTTSDCKLVPEFTITTTDDTKEFSFSISAAGEFVVDWGDGSLETITKPDTTNEIYTHNYATADAYTIGLSGQSTAYNTSTTTAAISFYVGSNTSAKETNVKKIAKIDGSLGAIFGTLNTGTNNQPRFYQTFDRATNMIGSIPENLFAGISGAPASYMFYYTFSMCSGLIGAIPDGLFGNLTGAPANYMFNGTFYGCSGLTGAIPDGLFGNLSGAPASNMFYGTFYGCSGLTGSIPENLFAGISGAPASNMFSSTFSGCSGLTGSIPENLFAGISGAPASSMFSSTFYNCSGLTSIPAGLFAGVSGAPASSMFSYTFSGCSGLTSIPENLFAGISGAPASDMFEGTFFSCRGLTGAIPDGLFGNLTGAPASSMFRETFAGCSGLTGAIPENLFAKISGAPAGLMFQGTFYGCSGLTGAIPDALFGNLTGAPANYMFNATFLDCSGLTGSIPENLFAGISGAPAKSMFINVFANCTSLTGPSARINGEYLYDIWPDATEEEVGGAYSNDTQLDDYRCIPTAWGGGGEDCSAPTVEFTLTTTADTKEFSFNISAAGTFYVDWGDGKTETITKPDTTDTTYSHNYASAGAYTIGLSGQATAYNPNTSVAAITFYAGAGYIQKMLNPRKIAKIDGSLGAIFSTLADGSQPRFYYTFRGGENLKQIPEGLFNGITGQPTSAMFFGTFGYCSGIKEIPEKLFAGIYGVPTAQIFTSTFEGCTSLTQIPQHLFVTISGTPASGMFRSTFLDCSSLISIPEGLFSGISGAPADNMYAGTFEGCTSLSGKIPQNLFGAIKGAPAQRMYFSTFARDANLSGEIPENLFGNLSGATQPEMFSAVFRGCTSLSGSSARINGQYLYDIWPDATETDVGMAYSNDTQLDDWPCIPQSWGGPGHNCIFDKFQITTTDNTNMFGVVLGAAGEFVIDWGDGKIQYINKSDTGWSEYTHDYSVSGQYTVKMTGSATGYSTWLSAISFIPRENVYSMSGSLASIFGTLPNGTQPLFSGAFQGCSELIEIPDNLFYGLTGKPAEWMFESTFSGCSSLTDLPPRLFDHFNGASPARSMFSGTFSGCTSLTQIPGDLFAGIYGPTAQELFRSTFSGCSSLTTVPGELFSMLRGAPSTLMFYETFGNCTSLTQIPENLFSSMSNKPATGLFQQTFSGCTSLTQIPAGLFANFSSTEQNMFNGTFQGCTSLTEIPVTLFKNISGNAADNSFESTFWGSKNIDKIRSVGGSYTNWVPAEFFPKLESGANAFDMMFTETALAQECPRYYRLSDVFWAPQIMPKVVCVPDFDGCPTGEYFDTDMGECTTCKSGNICPGGDEPPASCSVITNGEYPMSDTGKSDIADCYKMCEFTSDTCKATAHLDKVYYGYQCTYDCETLLGKPCEIVDNECKEIKCPNAYEYVDYECRQCQRENALSFADMPGCNPEVCESGFHPGANGCYGDSIPCVAANATQAHRQWDSVRNVYGLCTIIECADGYHLVDNVCLPNTGACTLANGIGMREWDFDKNEWGPCVASSCDPGYTNDSSLTDEVGQECGRCFNAYDEYGNPAVSTYVRECEIASCMYQGELYTLENNECRLICDEYSDETGRRYWDSSRKKCIHECMPGFTRW